jgi:hypothetical protein
MSEINGTLFLILYYAAGVVVFVVALIPSVIALFLVFSVIPSMLFTAAYNRLYKRLGFLPETTLFLVCCGFAGVVTANLMGSPPLCPDPLRPGSAPLLYLYQIQGQEPVPVLATATGPALGSVAAGSVIYTPTAPDAAAPVILATRVQLPGQKRPVVTGGLLRREDTVAARFFLHPFAFAERNCSPAFMVNPKSLLRWPW